MGSLAGSVLSNIDLIQQGVSLASQALNNGVSSHQAQREQELALRQLQDQQKLQAQQLAQQTALDREQIAVRTKQAEQDRQRALKRAVAKQRANFGSQGVGSGPGSSQAVLLGLFDESEDDLKARLELDALRNKALDLGITQNSSLGLLQRTQLQEKQKLNKLSSVTDQVKSVFDLGLGTLDIYNQYQDGKTGGS